MVFWWRSSILHRGISSYMFSFRDHALAAPGHQKASCAVAEDGALGALGSLHALPKVLCADLFGLLPGKSSCTVHMRPTILGSLRRYICIYEPVPTNEYKGIAFEISNYMGSYLTTPHASPHPKAVWVSAVLRSEKRWGEVHAISFPATTALSCRLRVASDTNQGA